MDEQSLELREYSKFYIEHVSRVLGFVMTSGFPWADAVECAQEAMIAALPPVWSTLDRPYAWCRRVAFRKAACQRKAKLRELSVLDPNEHGGAPLVAAVSDLGKFERTNEFLYWLGQLTNQDQRVVLAWTYDGAKLVEIATGLGKDPSWVRSTVRDARAVLRRLRAEEGDSSGDR
jgi:DNA-directed RNA polymerase specialized sigma24 family protein